VSIRCGVVMCCVEYRKRSFCDAPGALVDASCLPLEKPDLIDSCQVGWRIKKSCRLSDLQSRMRRTGPVASGGRWGDSHLLRWRAVSPWVFSQYRLGGGAGEAGEAGGGRRQANAYGSRPNLGRPKKLAGPVIRKMQATAIRESTARSRGPSSRHISSFVRWTKLSRIL